MILNKIFSTYLKRDIDFYNSFKESITHYIRLQIGTSYYSNKDDFKIDHFSNIDIHGKFKEKSKIFELVVETNKTKAIRLGHINKKGEVILSVYVPTVIADDVLLCSSINNNYFLFSNDFDKLLLALDIQFSEYIDVKYVISKIN